MSSGSLAPHYKWIVLSNTASATHPARHPASLSSGAAESSGGLRGGKYHYHEEPEDEAAAVGAGASASAGGDPQPGAPARR